MTLTPLSFPNGRPANVASELAAPVASTDRQSPQPPTAGGHTDLFILEVLGEHTSWKYFFIVLAVIAGAGAAFFLFVIEPRRKIYDYDLLDRR